MCISPPSAGIVVHHCPRSVRHGHCSEIRARDGGKGHVLLLRTQRTRGGPGQTQNHVLDSTDLMLKCPMHFLWTLGFALWRYFVFPSACHPEAGSRTGAATIPTVSPGARSLHSSHMQFGPALAAKLRTSSHTQKQSWLFGQRQGAFSRTLL